MRIRPVAGARVEASCPPDLDGDGTTGFSDPLAVLACFGEGSRCAADFDGDGDVDFGDLLVLLAAWGDC